MRNIFTMFTISIFVSFTLSYSLASDKLYNSWNDTTTAWYKVCFQAEALRRNGEYEKALKQYQEAEKKYDIPQFWLVIIQVEKSRIYQLQGKDNEAEHLLKQALFSYQTVTTLYYWIPKPDGKIIFIPGFTLGERYKDVISYHLALLYESQGKWNEALKYYKSCKELNDHVYTVATGLKENIKEINSWRSSVEFTHPREYAMELGNCYQHLGQFNEAIKEYERAYNSFIKDGLLDLDRVPPIDMKYKSFIELPKNIGDCYKAISDNNKAKQWFKISFDYLSKPEVEQEIKNSNNKDLVKQYNKFRELLPKLIIEN